MYRHLLVPIDDSDLSIEVVGNAVGLARAVGARITFFHAVADPSHNIGGDAELQRLTAHDDYTYAYAGKARELLAKAEAAARLWRAKLAAAAGRQASRRDRRAARATSCDLIFWPRTATAAGSAWRWPPDAERADARQPASAGLGHRRGPNARNRHHPRRAPLAGRGDARLAARAGRGPRGQRRRRRGTHARHRALHPGLPDGAAPSGGTAPVPAAARATPSTPARRAAAPASARRAADHRLAALVDTLEHGDDPPRPRARRRGAGLRPLPLGPRTRGRRDPAGRAEAPERADWVEIDRAFQANRGTRPGDRAFASCSHASSTARSNTETLPGPRRRVAASAAQNFACRAQRTRPVARRRSAAAEPADETDNMKTPTRAHSPRTALGAAAAATVVPAGAPRGPSSSTPAAPI